MEENDDATRLLLIALLSGEPLVMGTPDGEDMAMMSNAHRQRLTATCCAMMIERVTCELADHDAKQAINGVDAILTDLKNNIPLRCEMKRGAPKDAPLN